MTHARAIRTLPRAVRPGVTALLAVGLLTTSCTQSADRPPESRGAPSVTTGPDTAKWPKRDVDRGLAKGLTLPIEAYMVGYPDRVAVQKAQQQLERACMKRFGFTYDPPEPGHFPPVEYNDANMTRRYGISVPEEAAVHGYHLATDVGEPPTFEPESDAAGAVLTGTADGVGSEEVPEGGCAGEADRRVGSLDTVLASHLSTESLEESQRDPEVARALRAWSTCMKERGFDAPRPYEAVEISGSISAAEPTSKEISVAVADVSCKKSTDLVAIWFDAEVVIQRRLIEKNQLALQDAKTANDEAVRAAARII